MLTYPVIDRISNKKIREDSEKFSYKKKNLVETSDYKGEAGISAGYLNEKSIPISEKESRECKKIIRHNEPIYVFEIGKINPEQATSEYDTFQKSEIVYPDLVFTLSQNHGKYFRPTIHFANDSLQVVKDWVFYSAARDAGLEEIFCNVLDEVEAESRGYKRAKFNEYEDIFNRFLFFHNPTILPEKGKDVCLKCFWDNSCLEYLISPTNKNTYVDYKKFLEEIKSKCGVLRSIDGIVCQEPSTEASRFTES